MSAELAHVFPQFLPGGAAVLFGGVPAGVTNGENMDVEVLPLKTGRKKVLLHGGYYYARYLPTSEGSGHLVYIHEGTLFGVAFDPQRLEVRGTPAPLLEDVAADASRAGGGQFDFCQTGTFVYLSGKSAAESYPTAWPDSAGKTTPLVAQPGVYDAPRFSPDGKRLAYLATSGKGADVFVYDLASGTSTQLTFTAPGIFELAWAPDGKHLVYGGNEASGFALWWIRADRSGEPQKLLDGKRAMRPQSFSPDGRRLADSQNTAAVPDVFMLPLDLADPDHPKPGKPEAYPTSPLVEVGAAFSPDGRWLAYSTNEASTTDEIYVRPSAAGAGGSGGFRPKAGSSRHGRTMAGCSSSAAMIASW
jgi:eukaryotic-like serine/threonine-protein kinase